MEEHATIPVTRRRSRQLEVGDLTLGGDAPVRVQSMTTTDTRDVEATVDQILELAEAGCELVRVAVPDERAAGVLGRIKARIPIPLVADIHFHYKLALAACDEGVDKLRLNPGNIGRQEWVEEVVRKASDRAIPIRIGVNAGSLEKRLWQEYGGVTPEAMVESALGHCQILEEMGFTDIVVSLKAARVPQTVAAYRLMAEERDYPLHLGITEAGTPRGGIVKSSVGLGLLLAEGIGDTIRVSLAAPSVEEVRVGYEILKALEIRQRGINFVACPSCGRCEVDLIELAERVEERLKGIEKPLTVAVMGCAVNGPGEARQADIGIAGGRGEGLIFVKGKIVRKVKEDELVDEFMKELEGLL